MKDITTVKKDSRQKVAENKTKNPSRHKDRTKRKAGK
jgi:hypothetical protein